MDGIPHVNRPLEVGRHGSSEVIERDGGGWLSVISTMVEHEDRDARYDPRMLSQDADLGTIRAIHLHRHRIGSRCSDRFHDLLSGTTVGMVGEEDTMPGSSQPQAGRGTDAAASTRDHSDRGDHASARDPRPLQSMCPCRSAPRFGGRHPSGFITLPSSRRSTLPSTSFAMLDAWISSNASSKTSCIP